MDDNSVRRAENLRTRRLWDELEEDRIRRDRYDLNSRYNWEYNDRRRRVLDNYERNNRAMREVWHAVPQGRA